MKNTIFKYILLFLIIFLLGNDILKAQFYNGLQTNFGKNRVQYNDFYWNFYRFDRFDTYFYVNGDELAEYTAKYAYNELSKIENQLEYRLKKRMIFLIYNSLSDFRQSNIGLVSGDDEYNIGGVTKINRNKIFLYYEGDLKKFEIQIRSAIIEVILTEMLYGNKLRDKMANSSLINLPKWYVDGLISYVSEGWNFEIENKVKSAIYSEKFKDFNHLEGEDAKIAGHSIWYYINETYGKDVIPNIVHLTRVSKSADNGFLFVLGANFSELSVDWLMFYENIFDEDIKDKNKVKSNSILKKSKKERVYQHVKVSPKGNYIAYNTNEIGQYRLFLYDTKTKTHQRILKKEHRLAQITDYSYPLLAWHPSGDILSIIIEQYGEIWLMYYFVSSGEYEINKLIYFDKIIDFSYSENGKKLVFSAVVKGQSDIFVHDLKHHTNQRITNDIADDFNPKFANQDLQIVFSSNRDCDTLYNLPRKRGEKVLEKKQVKLQKYHDIFVFETNKRFTLTRLTNTKNIDEKQPFEIEENKYLFLSDKNGIINRRTAYFDSTIVAVDTAIHYRTVTTEFPMSNYQTNIIEHDLSNFSNLYAEILHVEGTNQIYTFPIQKDETEFNESLSNTTLRALKNKEFDKEEKIRKEKNKPATKILNAVEINALELDNIHININNYIFEIEKIYTDPNEIIDSITRLNKVKKFKIPKKQIYQTSFYTNELVNKVDFSLLNLSYQAFTGGAVFFNPGANVLLKIGINDLFEDYKLTGGVRFSGNFDSNEYLVSLEDLKKRWDKQYIFHRQTFLGINNTSVGKIHTHEVLGVIKYPFDQVKSLKTTLSLRNDKIVYLSTDAYNLYRDNIYKSWIGLKVEYIFDNIIQKSLNINNGLRFKFFAETYRRLDEKKSDLYVLGADFRHYQKIHRDIIFASRFAMSGSFGNTPLIYYLGSVDNWINLSSSVPTFNNSVEIDYSKNYAYQTLATNMRGFSQNIRNGNNFMVINTELRVPIVRYFAKNPINSGFLYNFQIIAFGDIGGAWSGLSPWTSDNAYDTQTLEQKPITVIIDNDREPLVAGFGFGLRSKLLGYFIRTDWAWGVENGMILPHVFYLSLSLDF